MNLKQGAVSGAILQAAGPSLQGAVLSAAGVTMLRSGNVIVTDGFDLKCRKVFHVVCPLWDSGAGQAEDVSDFGILWLKNKQLFFPTSSDNLLLTGMWLFVAGFNIHHQILFGGG